MKKNVFFALFALAALVFVGCEPTPTPTPDGGTTDGAVITVTPETLLMGVGEEKKLATTVAPQGTQLQITWTSDNQEVATVNAAGIVTAVAAGKANIIASAEGATADTCVVTVSNDAALDNFVLGGYGLFGYPELIPGTDTIIKDYTCQLAYFVLYAWDENLVYVDGTGFSGDGYMIVNDKFPVYVVLIEGEVAGYMGSANGFFVSEQVEGLAPYAVPAGKLVDEQKYGDGWKGLLFAETEEAATEAVYTYLESHTGTQVLEVYEGQVYIYIAANVTYAQLYETEEAEFYYDLKLGWYDFVNTDRWYCLACTTAETEDGKLSLESIVEPYDIRVIDKEYTNFPVEEVAASEVSILRPMTKHLYLGQEPLRNMKNTKVMYKK